MKFLMLVLAAGALLAGDTAAHAGPGRVSGLSVNTPDFSLVTTFDRCRFTTNPKCKAAGQATQAPGHRTSGRFVGRR